MHATSSARGSQTTGSAALSQRTHQGSSAWPTESKRSAVASASTVKPDTERRSWSSFPSRAKNGSPCFHRPQPQARRKDVLASGQHNAGCSRRRLAIAFPSASPRRSAAVEEVVETGWARAPGRLKLPAVPAGEVGAGLVGALEKGEQRRAWIRGDADGRIW